MVGAPEDDEFNNNAGAAYFFERTGSTWSQEQKLVHAIPLVDDNFGKAVAIDNVTIAVGAPFDDDGGSDSGAVHTFFQSSPWTQTQRLLPQDAEDGGWFGASVDLIGDVLVAGSPGKDLVYNNSGKAYLFERSVSSWNETDDFAVVLSSNQTGPQFGHSVDLSNDSVAIGAPLDDSAGTTSGRAYVYDLVIPAPDISVTVNDDVDPVNVGANFNYDVEVTNFGPGTSNAVMLYNVIPASTTFASVVASQGGCVFLAPSDTIFCSFGSLANGANATATIAVTAPNGSQFLVNTASVSSSSGDSDPNNNSDSEATTVQKLADLWVTKSDSLDPVDILSNLIYFLTVGNDGPEDATGVTLFDLLPGGMGFVSSTASCSGTTTISCNLGTIPAGQTSTVALSVTTPSLPLVVTNAAIVLGNEIDPNPVNSTVTESTSILVSQGADLELTKLDSPDPVTTTEQLLYTVVVTNNGPEDATGVTLVDILPATVSPVSSTPSTPTCNQSGATLTCGLGTLANGASTTVTILVTAPASTGLIINTATTTASEPDPDTSNNIATEITAVVTSTTPAFDCNKSLYIANEGNGGGGLTVVRVDCTGQITTYATGFSGTSGLVIDQVTGDMIVSDDFPGIHKVDTNGNVTPLATNFTFQNPNGLDLDGSGRLLVADSGDRILRVTLNPNGSAGVVETLATGFSIPQGVVETSGGDVLFSDSEGYIYRITSTTPLPVVYPGTSQRLPIGQVAPGNQGSIKLDAAGNIYTSDFGGKIVRISPDGTTAKHVVDIPQAACPVGQAGGDEPGFRGLVFDPEGDLVATGYCLDNVYIFQKSDIDNAWNTNTPISVLPAPFAQNPGGALDSPDLNGPFGIAFFDTLATSLGPSVDVSIGANPKQVKVRQGDQFSYTLTIANDVAEATDDVTVHNPIPAGVSLVSATPTVGSCGEEIGVVKCTIGTLAPAGTADVTVVLKPNTESASITSIATVTADKNDFNQTNNSVTVAVEVVAADPGCGNPPVADAGGPYDVTLPASLTLDASGSSSPCQPQGIIVVAFDWDLFKDGTVDLHTGTTTAQFSGAFLDNVTTSPATLVLIVTDSTGSTSTATTTVTVHPQPVAVPSVSGIGLAVAALLMGAAALFVGRRRSRVAVR